MEVEFSPEPEPAATLHGIFSKQRNTSSRHVFNDLVVTIEALETIRLLAEPDSSTGGESAQAVKTITL